MNKMKSVVAVFAFLAVIFSQFLYAADNGEKLFVNLSSDELNRSAMAIGFSTSVLNQKKIPVTIFLNVEAVRIADKNIPENRHVSGQSPKAMLAAFIKAGGRVIVCPMCLQNVGGMDKEDLIAGIEIGGPDVTWPALFAEGTTVLSY